MQHVGDLLQSTESVGYIHGKKTKQHVLACLQPMRREIRRQGWDVVERLCVMQVKSVQRSLRYAVDCQVGWQPVVAVQVQCNWTPGQEW